MCDQLGLKDGQQFGFITGILFVPTNTKVTIPLLQNVSDYAHGYFCNTYISPNHFIYPVGR